MLRMVTLLLTMMVLFLGGVLFGIERANEGVTNIRGYTTPTFSDAIQVNSPNEGKYEITVMGENFQQINLERKEREYQAVQSTHFTQQLAGNLEHGVKWFYNQMIHSAYQLAKSFF